MTKPDSPATPSTSADAARESARRATGQFGTQERDEVPVSLATVLPHADDTGPYGGGAVGSRYDGSDVAAIAKGVRGEVKRMRASGQIPGDWTVSVRSSRFAGGQAIDVAVEGVETEPHYMAAYDETIQRPTAAGAVALARLEEYLESHNYDHSSTQHDYTSVHFYGSVTANGGNRAWIGQACPECVTYRPCGC